MAKANPFRFSTQFQDNETDLLMYPHRPYNATTGRWLTRDPMEEDGGLNLYGFVANHPIDDIDVFGLMRWGELLAILDRANAGIKDIKCCCGKPTALKATITGTASGQQVTDTVQLEKVGCVDTIEVVRYYWWDCASAQSEYDGDHSPSKPKGKQAWQDYGWHEGGNPQTQSHKGWKKHWWDVWDMSHWNWQAAVLYVYCGKDGHYHAKLALSNALEWTWGDAGWGSPHDGSGSTVQ